MRHRYELLGGGIALVLIAQTTTLGIAGNPSHGSHVSALDSLSKVERATFALAALDARDRALQNFDYKVRESTTNIGVGDRHRRFLGRDDYELRRLGSTLWMRMVQLDRATGKVSTESLFSWDGKVQRGIGYPPYLGTSFHQCNISPKEDSNFAGRTFNELLGIRIEVLGAPSVPVATWLRDVLGAGKTIDVSEDVLDGIKTVCIRLAVGGGRFSFWLDPDHGFMIIRRHYQVGDAETRNQSTISVVSSVQVSGVWVPKKAILVTGSSNYPEDTEITYDVDKFTIGTVKPEDVALVFPPGGRVVDAIQHIAYFIRPDGTYRLLALADSRTHTINAPPDNAITAHVDAQAAKMYRQEPLIAANAPAPKSPRSVTRMIITALGALLTILALLVLVRRRRPFRI